MGTAISKTLAAAAVSALSLALAACGSGSKHAQFSWLAPSSVPAGWRIASIRNGATLPYPPGWRKVHGDFGTATAILFGPRSSILGYLNITPRQGHESLSNWASFRIGHNADEGDRGVKQLDVGTGLRFRSGHGTCVRDSYATTSGTSYVELACLVAGARASTVIVGASPPARWPQMSAQIERAIASFQT